MTSLCITGISGHDFATVSNLLFQGGLAQAKPIERESTISLNDWHKRVAPLLGRQQPVGRLWEQLAGDLLLANLHASQWGWADTASLAALSFWAELEPGLNFLLLTSDPEDYLAYRMLSDQSEDISEVNEHVCLKEWRDYHERMLNFYLDNSERCLLINTRQAKSNPEALFEKLSERFGLKLSIETTQLPALTIENSSNEAPVSLAYYIAEKALLGKDKEITPLHNELKAAQVPLAEPEAETDSEGNLLVTAKYSLTSILQDYQKRCAKDLTADERLALERLYEENESLLDRLNKVQEELEAANEKQQRLQQELAEAKALPAPDPQQEMELEDLRQENELLLLQLQQVQEELESVFIQAQENKKAKNESDHATQAIKAEGKELREKLEKCKAESEKTGQALRAESESLNKKLEQQVKENSQLKDQLVQHKQVESELNNQQQENELLLLQLQQVQEELEHYFIRHQEASKETEKLKSDNRKLNQKYQIAQQQLEQPRGFLSRFTNGSKQPALAQKLVYSAVQLRHEQVNKDYEHLNIILKDAIFGEQYSPEWQFRLSCAAVTAEEFGKQPKLEIPEQSDQLLQNWFSESENEYGRKLELRFALPNAMDTGVWKRINQTDQTLINDLLLQLPHILSSLEEKHNLSSRPWADWKTLVTDMQRIHHQKTKR